MLKIWKFNWKLWDDLAKLLLLLLIEHGRLLKLKRLLTKMNFSDQVKHITVIKLSTLKLDMNNAWSVIYMPWFETATGSQPKTGWNGLTTAFTISPSMACLNIHYLGWMVWRRSGCTFRPQYTDRDIQIFRNRCSCFWVPAGFCWSFGVFDFLWHFQIGSKVFRRLLYCNCFSFNVTMDNMFTSVFQNWPSQLFRNAAVNHHAGSWDWMASCKLSDLWPW